MLKRKRILQIICMFHFSLLSTSHAFAHERSCGSREAFPPEIVCGDENPADNVRPAGYCALLGASFDQNGHVLLRTLNPDRLTYEATLGFVLAKQTPLSGIRWYTEAISGATSDSYLKQISAVKTRMNRETSKVVDFAELNCVVLGPVNDMLLVAPPGDGTDQSMEILFENISSVIRFLNENMQTRKDPRKLKLFIADYPLVERVNLDSAAKNRFQANLAYASKYVGGHLNATIRGLPSPKVELANGVGVVKVWSDPYFTPRSEISGIGSNKTTKNGEDLWTFSGAPPAIHPDFATVCAAANRLTTAIYQSFNLQKPAYPAAADLCQRN